MSAADGVKYSDNVLYRSVSTTARQSDGASGPALTLSSAPTDYLADAAAAAAAAAATRNSIGRRIGFMVALRCAAQALS
jgi:hypothetical protein